MNRENNKYINTLSGEELDATQFNEFIRQEAKRQYEECSGGTFEDIPVDGQQDCILEQYNFQLTCRDWKCFNN